MSANGVYPDFIPVKQSSPLMNPNPPNMYGLLVGGEPHFERDRAFPAEPAPEHTPLLERLQAALGLRRLPTASPDGRSELRATQ